MPLLWRQLKKFRAASKPWLPDWPLSLVLCPSARMHCSLFRGFSSWQRAHPQDPSSGRGGFVTLLGLILIPLALTGPTTLP